MRSFPRLGAVAAALLAAGPAAFAHPGHGAPDIHAHAASDAWGFVALAVGIAAALAFGRRK